MGIWYHLMTPEMSNPTEWVAIKITTMGQSICLVNVHWTFMGKWGINPMGISYHSMIPEISNPTGWVAIKITTMGQSVCTMNVHCTFMGK